MCEDDDDDDDDGGNDDDDQCRTRCVQMVRVDIG